VNYWKRIQQLNLKQLFQLIVLFASQPLLIRPTFIASKRTMSVCDELFGKSHHKNNRANAFRHALWNILICQNTLKWTKNVEKSIVWAQKVTFLYEKVTKNKDLERFMDLHNNAVGRNQFLVIFDKKEDKIIQLLQNLMENAHKLMKIDQKPILQTQLIYIED
jgi:hypothetical protein